MRTRHLHAVIAASIFKFEAPLASGQTISLTGYLPIYSFYFIYNFGWQNIDSNIRKLHHQSELWSGLDCDSIFHTFCFGFAWCFLFNHGLCWPPLGIRGKGEGGIHLRVLAWYWSDAGSWKQYCKWCSGTVSVPNSSDDVAYVVRFVWMFDHKCRKHAVSLSAQSCASSTEIDRRMPYRTEDKAYSYLSNDTPCAAWCNIHRIVFHKSDICSSWYCCALWIWARHLARVSRSHRAHNVRVLTAFVRSQNRLCKWNNRKRRSDSIRKYRLDFWSGFAPLESYCG